MQPKKPVLMAAILSASMGLGVQTVGSQDLPGTRPPIPEKIEPRPSPPSEPEQRPDEMAGISAENIKKVEQALKARGHNPGAIDGIIDQRTREALRQFQKLNNLAVTGILDNQTAGMLGVQLEGDPSGPLGEEMPETKRKQP